MVHYKPSALPRNQNSMTHFQLTSFRHMLKMMNRSVSTQKRKSLDGLDLRTLIEQAFMSFSLDRWFLVVFHTVRFLTLRRYLIELIQLKVHEQLEEEKNNHLELLTPLELTRWMTALS